MAAKTKQIEVRTKTDEINKLDRDRQRLAIRELRKQPTVYRRFKALQRMDARDGDNCLKFWWRVGHEAEVIQRENPGIMRTAVSLLADALGRAESAIYKSVQFVRMWPTREMFKQDILQPRGLRGARIAYSHLTVIVHVPDAIGDDIHANRREMVSLVLSKGLSYRALVEEIKLRYPSCDRKSESGDQDGAIQKVGSMSRMATAAHKLAEKMGNWEKTVLSKVKPEDLMAHRHRLSSLADKMAGDIESLDNLSEIARRSADRIKSIRSAVVNRQSITDGGK